MVESMLAVNPTQSYAKNTKSPIQDFHRFRYQNLLKIDFCIKLHTGLQLATH